MRKLFLRSALVAIVAANFLPVALAAAEPQTWYIELAGAPAGTEDDDTRRQRVLGEASQALGRTLEPTLVYGAHGEGFALTMSSTEARRLRGLPDIAVVEQEIVRTVADYGGSFELAIAAPGQGGPATVGIGMMTTPLELNLNLAGQGGDPYAEPASAWMTFQFGGGRRHFWIDGGASNVDLYVGADLNHDGKAQLDEETCRSVTDGPVESCVTTGADWVIVHNREGTGQGISIRSFSPWGDAPVPPGVTNGMKKYRAVVSAPGRVERGGKLAVRLGHDDPSMGDGDQRMILLYLDGAIGKRVLPLRLVREGSGMQPYILHNNEELRLTLRPGGVMDRLVFDLPKAVSDLYVSMIQTGAGNTRFYLWRDPSPGSGPDVPAVPDDAIVIEAQKLSDRHRALEFWEEDIGEGRWYLMPANLGGTPADVRVMASSNILYMNRVRFRPGSYYNPDRAGHGVFVYPAGNFRVLLWYTYDDQGQPTWYYSQIADPEASLSLFRGSETGELSRVVWVGDKTRHYPIGQVTLTSTTPDSFMMAYSIDGKHGVEHMRAFLGGCPSVDGQPLDASAHWFDPTYDGNGYSLQVHPGYEFLASFNFDAQGMPRFLLAERAGPFDATDPELVLEQLRGPAPWQPHFVPTRTPVGVARRHYAGGSLASVEMDAAFTNGVPGQRRVTETVIPLTGRQGCVP